MLSSRDLFDPGIKPRSPELQDSLLSEPTAPNKMDLEVYRRCVICLYLFPATVFCFVFFFQLTCQSRFYSPESYQECKCKLSLKGNIFKKANFYLE